jgi:hypothetical protein
MRIATQQRAIAAEQAIKQLNGMHDRFIQELESGSKQPSGIGTLAVSSKEITCVCLGRNVAVSNRPVALDGEIKAIEYDFITRWKDEDLSILRLYLQPNGTLTRDPDGTAKFQDFNNTYISDHILAAVSDMLLVSAVYAPAKG